MADGEEDAMAGRRFWCEHVRGAGLVALLIVLPIVQLLLPRVGPAFGAGAILICAIAHLLSPRGARWSAPMATGTASRIVLTCLAVAIIWAAVTISWGQDRLAGIDAVITVCLGFAGGWYLAHHFALIPHERLPIVILLGLLTGAVCLIAGLEHFDILRSVRESDYQSYDLNRIAISSTVLLPLLILVSARSRLYAGAGLAIFAITMIAVFRSESESAKIALLVGSGVGLIVFLLPQSRKAIMASMALTVLSMPFAIPLIERLSQLLSESIYERGNVEHRLVIWKGYADQALERLWFGWGMKSDLHVGQLPETLIYAKAQGIEGSFWSPHNLALELFINVGLIGTLPLALALAACGFLSATDRISAAAYTSMMAAAASIFLTGSSGFQGWLITAYAVAGAVLWALSWRRMAGAGVVQ